MLDINTEKELFRKAEVDDEWMDDPEGNEIEVILLNDDDIEEIIKASEDD